MMKTVANMKARRQRGEKGFSLVELLVVVAILAILAAIAIPLFLNQKKKAYNASAESDLSTIVKELSTDTTWNAVTSNGATASAFTYTSGTQTLSVPAANLVPSVAISVPSVNINSASTVQGGIIAGTTFAQGSKVVTNADTTHGWCIMVTNNGETAVYSVASVAGGNAIPKIQPTMTSCSAAGVMS